MGTAGTENATKPQEPETIQPAVNEEEAPAQEQNTNAKPRPVNEEATS